MSEPTSNQLDETFGLERLRASAGGFAPDERPLMPRRCECERPLVDGDTCAKCGKQR
jgi:hypothetical protein